MKRVDPQDRSLLKEKSKEKNEFKNSKVFFEEKRSSIKYPTSQKSHIPQNNHLSQQIAHYFKDQKFQSKVNDHEVLKEKTQNKQMEEKELNKSLSKKYGGMETTKNQQKSSMLAGRSDPSTIEEANPGFINTKKKTNEHIQIIQSENMYCHKPGALSGCLVRNKSNGRTHLGN